MERRKREKKKNASETMGSFYIVFSVSFKHEIVFIEMHQCVAKEQMDIVLKCWIHSLKVMTPQMILLGL